MTSFFQDDVCSYNSDEDDDDDDEPSVDRSDATYDVEYPFEEKGQSSGVHQSSDIHTSSGVQQISEMHPSLGMHHQSFGVHQPLQIHESLGVHQPEIEEDDEKVRRLLTTGRDLLERRKKTVPHCFFTILITA